MRIINLESVKWYFTFQNIVNFQVICRKEWKLIIIRRHQNLLLWIPYRTLIILANFTSLLQLTHGQSDIAPNSFKIAWKRPLQ